MGDLSTVDRITRETLAELAGLPGPWATMTLPTARTGPEVRQGPQRFRGLAHRAIDLLAGLTGPEELERLAADLEAIRVDHEFWEHQADGLVVLASPGGVRTFRVAAPLPESVRASNVPGLTELALQVDAGEAWFVVAVSQNRVRLLKATAHTVDELPLEDIPADFDEAVGDIERQEHLTWSARPGGGASFHGLGGGGENDKVWLEKYLRRVADGLDGHSSRPADGTVVLAGVESLVASLRSIWGASGVLSESVGGNMDHKLPEELQAAALPLVEAAREGREAVLLERVGAKAQRDLADIRRAAAEGRVSELVLGPSADGADHASVDPAIRDTIVFGGTVVPLQGLGQPMAALTRY